MKQITSISYNELLPKITWVSNYYDQPLSGICKYDGKTCYFDAEYTDDFDIIEYAIYHLSPWEKFKLKYRHIKFKVCVGSHWDYVNGKRTGHFYMRRPKWLFKILWYIHYRRPYR